MPTGYTNEIYNGKEVSGEDFILRCARQFGGLVHMGDKALGTPITYRETDLEYYDEKIEEARETAKKYHRMTREEVERELDETQKEIVELYCRRLKEKTELESRYRKVLSEVKAWEPPTVEHHELKEFAIKQLEDSIKFDCDISHLVPPERPDADKYIEDMITAAEKERKYYWNEKRNAIKRDNEANKWIDELLSSLGKKGEIK